MPPTLVDTDILSMFLKGQPLVISRFETYLQHHAKINLSLITYYEITSGLKHLGATKRLTIFLEFCEANIIVPLSQPAVEIAASLYAELRLKGTPVDDIDLFIAGTALAHNMVLATHNVRHFGRITPLQIVDWGS